jgi:hypothetical protein
MAISLLVDVGRVHFEFTAIAEQGLALMVESSEHPVMRGLCPICLPRCHLQDTIGLSNYFL